MAQWSVPTCNGTRLRKLAGTSIKALGSEENTVFDFICVDGSHQRDDVMIDCLGACCARAA